MKNNEVLKHYFPEQADSVEHTEELNDPREELVSQEYKGEWKYTTKLPSQIREMLEHETDEDEIGFLEIAVGAHQKLFGGDGKAGTECGEPYRGEIRETKKVNKLSDLVGENGNVTDILSQGYLELD